MQQLEPRNDGVTNTLTTVQKDNLLCEPIQNTSKYGETRVFEEINETNTREVLQILWCEVGEETIQWAVGRLHDLLKEEILRQGLCVEVSCESRGMQSVLQPSTSFFEEDNVPNRAEGDEVRDMREDDKHRCSSQGFRLSKQFTKEFDDLVSKLSYEGSQVKECMSYLWRACEGASTLQQTFTAIQEAWRSASPTMEYTPQIKYRIRKLTPVEVFRLMGVEDKDIDTLLNASISNSQLYKLAGNSIVKDVLYHIFRKIYVEQQPDNGVQTLF